MKRTTSIVIAMLLLVAGDSFAGNGDLLVDGKLGVGTTNPGGSISVFNNMSDLIMKLEDNRTAITGDFLTKQAFYDYFGEAAYIGVRHNYYLGSTPRALAFGVDGSEVMRINKTGNVGIGTATPNTKLAVAGAISATGYVGSHMFGTGTLIGGDGTNAIVYGRSDTLWAPMYIDASKLYLNAQSGGYVGIGTSTPAYTLDVNGTIRGTNVSPSDLRLKENIVPVEDALLKVQTMQGVTFNWKTDATGNFPHGRHYGVIAQEIEKVLPEVVSTGADGTKAVAYTEIIPVLIEAIKEQQKLIEKQHAELQEIRALVGAR